MLHVLFILLKIIGMILAFLICLIVIFLAVPIRYSFQTEKKETIPFLGQIKVTWLFSILYLKASYIDKVFDYRVRIFGYQILGNQPEFLEKKKEKERRKSEKEKQKEEKNRKKEEKQRKNKKKEKEEKEELKTASLEEKTPSSETLLLSDSEDFFADDSGEDEEITEEKFIEGQKSEECPEKDGESDMDSQPENSESNQSEESKSGQPENSESNQSEESKSSQPENPGLNQSEKSKSNQPEDSELNQSEESKSNQPEEPKLKGKQKSGKRKGAAKRRKPFFLTSIKEKVSSAREKVSMVKNLYAEYHGQQLLLLAKGSIIKLLKHILPYRLRGTIRFGFDDPSTTGILTGLAAIVYPKYHKSFSLEPDFQNQCFEADCKGNGRVRLGYILYIGICILLNKDIRRIIKLVLD